MKTTDIPYDRRHLNSEPGHCYKRKKASKEKRKRGKNGTKTDPLRAKSEKGISELQDERRSSTEGGSEYGDFSM